VETYKYHAAIGKIPGLLSISFNAYNKFAVKKIKLVDGKNIRFADSDILFLKVNGRNQIGANSMISLVRFQFLEILLKLALKRYYYSMCI
jgi:hypothetical protein